jgi:hypothetical protein
MTRIRYRDRDDSIAGTFTGIVVGALAGFAVGVIVAQKTGGVSGLAARLRERARGLREEMLRPDIYDEAWDEVEDDEDGTFAALERNVLEAFKNDEILAGRAVDLSALNEDTVELSGWVHSEDESQHAVTIARGVPGVATVVNRLSIGDEEARLADAARRREQGDAAYMESHWEGQRVGTGRRRQGNSSEPDRHADPKPGLESRWLDESEAMRNAADDIARPQPLRGKGPASTRGVPKADHVGDSR